MGWDLYAYIDHHNPETGLWVPSGTAKRARDNLLAINRPGSHRCSWLGDLSICTILDSYYSLGQAISKVPEHPLHGMLGYQPYEGVIPLVTLHRALEKEPADFYPSLKDAISPYCHSWGGDQHCQRFMFVIG